MAGLNVMRIGLIGPANGSLGDLERALSLCMDDAEVRQIIYLGADDAAGEIVERWAKQRLGPEQFLARGAELACSGSPEEIGTLLSEQDAAQRLLAVRRLPEPPARAIEMMDTWLVLAVHDKAVLEEDDIANAHVIVYGHASEAAIKRFGPRCFFTPGPITGGKLGMLTLRADGQLDISLLDLQGKVLANEALQANAARLVVTT
jgi:hypothetical protein